MRGFLLLAAGVPAVVAQSGTGGSADKTLMRVIGMLNDMSAKIEASGQEDAVIYDKFACYCKEQASEKTYNIEKSDEKITELDADIASLKANIDKLEGEIAEHTMDINLKTKQKENAEAQKESETEARENAQDDFAKNVQMIDQIISYLKGGKLTDNGIALMQTPELMKALSAFSPKSASFLQKKAPVESGANANAYEFQSQGVIDMITNIREMTNKRAAEVDAAHAGKIQSLSLKISTLEDEIQFHTEDKTEKTAERDADITTKIDKEADRDQEQKDRDADFAFRAELTTNCETEATEYDDRSEKRASEITAITNAVNALTDNVKGAVKNARVVKDSFDSKKAGMNKNKKDLDQYALLQQSADDVSYLVDGLSFMQVESKESIATRKVLNLLGEGARSLKSNALTLAVMKVSDVKDHFKNVRAIITDLVSKLDSQLTTMKSEKEACDKKMKAAIKSRDDAQAELEKERKNIAVQTQNIEDAEEAIKIAKAKIAQLTKQLAEATKLRDEESKFNKAAEADAKEGGEAVAEAINILGARGYKVALLQQPNQRDRDGNSLSSADEVNSIRGQEYEQNSASSTVMGLLNTIKDAFETTETEANKTETDSEQAYKNLKAKIDEEIGDKDTNEGLEGKVATEQKKLSDAKIAKGKAEKAEKNQKKIKTGVLKKLETVLRPQCVDGQSFEERRDARLAEIEQLKQALQILQDASRDYA